MKYMYMEHMEHMECMECMEHMEHMEHMEYSQTTPKGEGDWNLDAEGSINLKIHFVLGFFILKY